ncbi:MAG TPA: acetate uptake transporter, partial [Acidimicrobiales bacterium]|nr:acetate uptake transporter [Acidimicrobiales bacterium]
NGEGFEDIQVWRSRARVVLSPIAAPSVLGLYGFCAATLIVAANLAGWYGNSTSGIYIFPFAAIFGGLAQLLAGMWAYKARDGLATAMHGMWGSFWLSYGILWALIAGHVLAAPAGVYFPELAFWFIMLAAITWVGSLAATAENVGLVATLVALAAGSSLLAAAYLSGALWLERFGGWVLVGSAGAAFYTASAMMLENSFGRTVLPLLKYKKDALVPGRQITEPIQFPRGMPGVRVGQ